MGTNTRSLLCLLFTFTMAMLLVFTLAGCANGTETIQEERESAEVSFESIEENRTSEYSVEEVGFERDGLHIYGELFLPKSDAPLPLVVISHGFGGNARQVRAYAEMFAENGIAACAFDFIGGGSGSRSDGKITEMSVLTEAADLNFVKEHLGRAETDEAISGDKAMEDEEEMKIRVSDGTNEVTFLMNGSSASKSLYGQLPLTIEVENYSSNEKIFYPPEKLDTSDVIERDGPFGTLAYFSPWGNVVMYYSECGEYPGLYIMGEAIEGADLIEKLSGTILVTALDAE